MRRSMALSQFRLHHDGDRHQTTVFTCDDEDVQVCQSTGCAPMKSRSLGKMGQVYSDSSVSTMASLQDLQAFDDISDYEGEDSSISAELMDSRLDVLDDEAVLPPAFTAPSDGALWCEKAVKRRSVTFLDVVETIEIIVDADAELLPILRTRSRSAEQLKSVPPPDDCCFYMLKAGLRIAFG